MTKADKLIQLVQQVPDGLSIELSANSSDGPPKVDYVAEFKPDYLNPLHIKDIDYNENDESGYPGNCIAISYESAVELAKFLKEFFLDEEPQE
jgi:hypothetical protein